MKLSALLTIGLVTCALPLIGQQARSVARGDFEISGRVVNAITGEVVRGATLQLAPADQRGNTQRFDAGSDGSFIFHNLAAGKYSLSAQAAGFPPQTVDEHGQFSTAIVVGKDKTSTDIIFRLRPEGSISGRVLDEHNEPLRSAQVMLFEKSADSGRRMIERRSQSQTDDLGEYHFSHLRAGTYYLALTAQPWYRRYMNGGYRRVANGQVKAEIDPALDVAYPVIYYPGVTDSDGAGAIALHAGDRVTADFDVTPVQSLHVTIRADSSDGNAPLQPNFRERVFGEPWGFAQPNLVFGQGEIEISGIAPGDYDLALIHRAGKDTSVRSEEISLQGDGEIDPSAVSELESIHGKIKFDGSNSPSNAVIQLRDTNTGRFAGGRVDEQGEFKIQPPHAGRYVVSLSNAPGYAIRTLSATGAHLSGRTLEISGSQAVELSVDASEGVGTINGTVMSGDKPISGAMVVLVPPDMGDSLSLFRRDQSDSDGTFTLRSVVPGTYTAIAIQNGWDMEWASPEALRPYLAKGTRVQISGKQNLDVQIAAQ